MYKRIIRDGDVHIDKNESVVINNHLDKTMSEWFRVLYRFENGNILIKHGHNSRSYGKVIRLT